MSDIYDVISSLTSEFNPVAKAMDLKNAWDQGSTSGVLYNLMRMASPAGDPFANARKLDSAYANYVDSGDRQRAIESLAGKSDYSMGDLFGLDKPSSSDSWGDWASKGASRFGADMLGPSSLAMLVPGLVGAAGKGVRSIKSLLDMPNVAEGLGTESYLPPIKPYTWDDVATPRDVKLFSWNGDGPSVSQFQRASAAQDIPTAPGPSESPSLITQLMDSLFSGRLLGNEIGAIKVPGSSIDVGSWATKGARATDAEGMNQLNMFKKKQGAPEMITDSPLDLIKKGRADELGFNPESNMDLATQLRRQNMYPGGTGGSIGPEQLDIAGYDRTAPLGGDLARVIDEITKQTGISPEMFGSTMNPWDERPVMDALFNRYANRAGGAVRASDVLPRDVAETYGLTAPHEYLSAQTGLLSPTERASALGLLDKAESLGMKGLPQDPRWMRPDELQDISSKVRYLSGQQSDMAKEAAEQASRRSMLEASASPEGRAAMEGANRWAESLPEDSGWNPLGIKPISGENSTMDYLKLGAGLGAGALGLPYLLNLPFAAYEAMSGQTGTPPAIDRTRELAKARALQAMVKQFAALNGPGMSANDKRMMSQNLSGDQLAFLQQYPERFGTPSAFNRTVNYAGNSRPASGLALSPLAAVYDAFFGDNRQPYQKLDNYLQTEAARMR